MGRPVVVVAETIADAALAALTSDVDVDIAVGLEHHELMARLGRAAGLIVRSATHVDAAMIAAAPELQVIGRAGVGVDNIDVDAATQAGVMVVNAPDANTVSAAEHTIALLLAQARHIAEADASLRAGAWERKRFKGVELSGKTLGILGLGRIGTLVAMRASAFGMRLLAYDPYVTDERVRTIGAQRASLQEVFAGSDFVTIHLPRNGDTLGLIDAAALSAMKPGVRLVNVARGGIVDESALADAIRSGHVGGAAIDVFAEEPTTDSPLFSLRQVVVTPHLGASTQEAQDKAGLAVAEAVVAALNGELVPSAVNLSLGGVLGESAQPYVRLAEGLGQVFASFAHGLPTDLLVSARGRDLEGLLPAIALAATKGVLVEVSEEPVSYVNAPVLAAQHGMKVHEEALAEAADYRAVVLVSGRVAGIDREIAGAVMAHRGPVLVNVDGYELEFPVTRHMLLVRNADTPGVIGSVGTALGDAGINISDMAVGRGPNHGAMMGISLDQAVDAELLEAIRALDGVLAARSIQLS
jgi:D-3-phosphoglycerate dehydrogenase